MARKRRGATTAEAVKDLTKDQTAALRNVKTLRSREEAAEARWRDSIEAGRRGVADALDSGVPASLVAEYAGVSAGRVYQMRDQVRTAEALAGAAG